ncbi:zeta toxin family protein [Rhodoferax lacus]|uniref:zeta toxin family protein n=1 Tax=Rhodoferax lacus TaxID=2184758 RepID=UPI001EFF37C0|nr:zeta toxin family protein [Rhodoferax lacus]
MASDKPVFFLLAGPNGAGKSTLYKAHVLAGTIPATAEFVNADVYEAAHLQHIADPVARSEQARLWADTRRAQLLQMGHAFVSETVFSHPSKLALIADAQAKGYFVMLLVVALDDAAQLLERVARRVNEGGHPVPIHRILERYPRTLANLSRAVRLADAAVLYDSSDSAAETQKAVALCKGAWTQELVAPLLAWAQQVLALGLST